MNKKIISASILLNVTILFSQTTMCYKQNHTSMATIEDTKLNGGECSGNKSLNDMKNEGWNVEDIKITQKDNTYDFIYILKNNSLNSSFSNSEKNLSQKELEKKIIKKLEAKKKDEKKQKELEKKLLLKAKGEKLYKSKCSSCHGQKGEKKASNQTLILKDMPLEDIKFAISQYTNSYDYGKGKQYIMKPYATNTNSNELNMIYAYLRSVN